MRYARQEDLQKLALTMQGSAEGISLADIEIEFKVSRRTAERMRDAVRNAYPQIEEISGSAPAGYSVAESNTAVGSMTSHGCTLMVMLVP